jgi:multidrug efflux pump subunit AcrA (membrane-fusion protein)
MQKKMIIIPIAILLGGFIIMQFLMSFREDLPSAAKKIQAKIVEVQLVELTEVTSHITGYGRVTSAQPVILISEVNGNLVPGTVPFRPAQDFKKGDILIKVDDRQIRLDINSAKSDLLNALSTVLPEIKVDFPEDYDRWQDYFNTISYDKKLALMPDTQNQKIKLFLSRFNVYKLYFQIRNLEIQLEKHFFVASFNGSIISTELHAGSTARVGTRLGEIINLDDLEIEVPLPIQDIEWIDRDKPVKFSSADMSGTWYGRVIRIGKNIDTRTQTVQVFMNIKNSKNSGLFNGVFLKTVIPGRKIEHAMTIPRKLIYEDHYVYLVNNGQLVYRKVDIARRELDSVILNGGLAINDTLVTEVLQGVADGMLAEPTLITKE